jgi:hypothetical protein
MLLIDYITLWEGHYSKIDKQLDAMYSSKILQVILDLYLISIIPHIYDLDNIIVSLLIWSLFLTYEFILHYQNNAVMMYECNLRPMWNHESLIAWFVPTGIMGNYHDFWILSEPMVATFFVAKVMIVLMELFWYFLEIRYFKQNTILDLNEFGKFYVLKQLGKGG